MYFKRWLETLEQPVQPVQRRLRDYFEILGLPTGIAQRPDAYAVLEKAYQTVAATHPEAKDAYVKVHGYLDRQQGGKHFDQFFRDVTQGKSAYVPHSEFKPVLDMAGHEPWMQVREKYHGNFDKHIKTSIPTFGELQDKKGHALVRAFGDGNLTMLDIGGSEGSFARTISHLTNGQIQTEVLDPNDAMHDFYHSVGQTPGSVYNKAAFMKGWMNDDGSRMPELNSQTTDKRYDIIHEAMAFQFISSQRDAQVNEVKSLLKPGGLFLTEQKFKTDNWDYNEAFKDKHHKDLYYTKAALQQKEKVVAFAAEKKYNQDKDEEEAVGMVNNMVHHNEYEQLLARKFSVVYQYWDSGNFKGYAASDGNEMVQKFLSALGPVNSKFSTVQLPRKIEPETRAMPSYGEWSQHMKHLSSGLPTMQELQKLTHKEIREKYGDKLRQAAKEKGLDVSDDDLGDIIDKLSGLGELEFDCKDYDRHC